LFVSPIEGRERGRKAPQVSEVNYFLERR